jgi:hypothetical protein
VSESASYTFDWRRPEHARVSALLVREMFGRGVRRALKWIVIGVWLLCAAMAVAGLTMGDLSVAWQLVPLVVVVGALLAVFYRLTGWLHARQVGRNDPNVAHPITHTADASGFRVATHSATVDLRWDRVHKVRETEDMFLVYYIPRFAYFLPKRAVGSSREVEELRNRIRGWLPADTPYEQDS